MNAVVQYTCVQSVANWINCLQQILRENACQQTGILKMRITKPMDKISAQWNLFLDWKWRELKKCTFIFFLYQTNYLFLSIFHGYASFWQKQNKYCFLRMLLQNLSFQNSCNIATFSHFTMLFCKYIFTSISIWTCFHNSTSFKKNFFGTMGD